MFADKFPLDDLTVLALKKAFHEPSSYYPAPKAREREAQVKVKDTPQK